MLTCDNQGTFTGMKFFRDLLKGVGGVLLFFLVRFIEGKIWNLGSLLGEERLFKRKVKVDGSGVRSKCLGVSGDQRFLKRVNSFG